jgi:hypothetical protein
MMLGIFFGRNPIVAAIGGIAGVALLVAGLVDSRHILAVLGGVMLVGSVIGLATRRGRR